MRARTKKGKLVEELLDIGGSASKSESHVDDIRLTAVEALLRFIDDAEVRVTFKRVWNRTAPLKPIAD